MGMELNYDETGTTSYVFLFAGISIYLGLASCRTVGGENNNNNLTWQKGRMEKKKAGCLPMG